jgi:hypothetical protein
MRERKMVKNRSGKIPEKIQPEQPALETDKVRKAARRRPASPDRSSGFGVEIDRSPVTWFLD